MLQRKIKQGRDMEGQGQHANFNKMIRKSLTGTEIPEGGVGRMLQAVETVSAEALWQEQAGLLLKQQGVSGSSSEPTGKRQQMRAGWQCRLPCRPVLGTLATTPSEMGRIFQRLQSLKVSLAYIICVFVKEPFFIKPPVSSQNLKCKCS